MLDTLSILWRSSQQLRRLRLGRDRLQALQRTRLRRLLRDAKQRSPFYAERLRDVDPDTFTLEDLVRLPPLTKAEVMANFDRLVTDDRVRLDAAWELVRAGDPGALLLDRYRVACSSGSSGWTGLTLFDRRAWHEVQAGNMRMSLRDHLSDPSRVFERSIIAVITASGVGHLSTQLARSYAAAGVSIRHFSVADPLPELLGALEAVQPVSISGYPSTLAELARATLAGALRISPRRVLCSAEPLLAQQRAVIEDAWGGSVGNVWASSEAGPLAVGCFRGPGMHVNEDLVIVEPVDEDGRPIAPGQTSTRVFVTPLFNRLFPLVRFELTDRIAWLDEPCRCGATLRRIADIEERYDVDFDYEGVRVHPAALQAALAKQGPEITDFQVFQTRRGVKVVLRTRSDRFGTTSLANDLRATLAEHGLGAPEVELDPSGEFQRLPSGKLKRYMPLGGPQELVPDPPAFRPTPSPEVTPSIAAS